MNVILNIFLIHIHNLENLDSLEGEPNSSERNDFVEF